ncbi:MAG: hypothetical protein RL318_1326 [Fibrobacterota bacterium]|jgi:hypothetical protein
MMVFMGAERTNDEQEGLRREGVESMLLSNSLPNGLTDIRDPDLLAALAAATEFPSFTDKDGEVRKIFDQIFLEMRLGAMLGGLLLAFAGSGAAVLIAFAVVTASLHGR